MNNPQNLISELETLHERRGWHNDVLSCLATGMQDPRSCIPFEHVANALASEYFSVDEILKREAEIIKELSEFVDISLSSREP